MCLARFAFEIIAIIANNVAVLILIFFSEITPYSRVGIIDRVA